MKALHLQNKQKCTLLTTVLIKNSKFRASAIYDGPRALARLSGFGRLAPRAPRGLGQPCSKPALGQREDEATGRTKVYRDQDQEGQARQLPKDEEEALVGVVRRAALVLRLQIKEEGGCQLCQPLPAEEDVAHHSQYGLVYGGVLLRDHPHPGSGVCQHEHGRHHMEKRAAQAD